MGEPKSLAADVGDVVTLKFLSRSEGDGVNADVEPRPARAEVVERRRHCFVLAHVAFQAKVRFELGRELSHPLAEALVLVGEGELGAFAAHRPCDAPGNRPLARNARDQGTFTVEKSHVAARSKTVMLIRRIRGECISRAGAASG